MGWSRRKNCKPQEIFVEIFLVGGPLTIWRGAHVDLPRGSGEVVSYANSGGATHFVATEIVPVTSSPTSGSRQQEACCAEVSSENPGGASAEDKNC